MSLEHAILGFLTSKPISGYDLKKMFDMTVKHFWSADQSQIYRTLNKLTEDGLIEMELVIQDSKPNSKIYHITKKGKDEFLDWLKSPPPIAEPRIPWLIQVYFASHMSDEEIIRNLKQIAAQVREKHKIYGQIDKPAINVEMGVQDARDIFLKELTYDYGLTMYDMILGWIDKVIEKLEKKEYNHLNT